MKRIAFLLLFLTSTASADQFEGDWDTQGFSYQGVVYSSIKLDLDVLPRFVDVNGVIEWSDGQFFRPIDGTCVIENTGDVICILTLDALTLSIRLEEDLSGSVDLIDTGSQETLAAGLLLLNSIK